MNRQFIALNGLAIVIVVLVHSIHFTRLSTQQMSYPEATGVARLILLALSGLSIFAVPTFLMTSGAFMAYAARRSPPRLPWRSVRAALERILRPYVLWSIVFYLLVFIQRGESYSLFGYIKNLIVGYPYNFIPLLAFFYALSPFLVRLIPRYGYLVLTFIGLYQGLLIFILTPKSFGAVPPGFLRVLAPPVLSTTLALWAIFFPIGLVYGLKMQHLAPILTKLKWPLVAVTLALYVIAVLHSAGVIFAPMAAVVARLSFVLILPSVSRKVIPQVRRFEKISKRSYGLYLMHLIVLDLVMLAIQAFLPDLHQHPLLMMGLLFATGMIIPMAIMGVAAKIHFNLLYRYVFG